MGDAASKLDSNSDSDLSGDQMITDGEGLGQRADSRTTPGPLKTPESGTNSMTSITSRESDVSVTTMTLVARTRFSKHRLDTSKSLPASRANNNDVTSDVDSDTFSVDDSDGKESRFKTTKRSFSQNDSQNLLGVPLDTRPSSPIHFDDDIIGSDEDPFEGMTLPRKRIDSLGSVSVYSVKEISDDLYKDYFRRIKLFLKGQGLLDSFPTPSLLTEAQVLYRRMDLPAPIDNHGQILPHPPRHTVSEAFSNKLDEKFNAIKERVLKFQSPIDFTSKLQVEAMASKLCKDMKEDIHKFVTMATWLLCQDSQHRNENHPQPTAEDVCKVFHTMCKSGRIMSKIVRGSIRGPEFEAGQNAENHRGVWLCAFIDGMWCILDPISTMKHFTNKTKTFPEPCYDNLDQYVQILKDPDFLFEDPVKFIFTHFPNEEYWQLLARIVTKDELSELALLREGFFKMDLSIVKQPKSLVIVDGKSSVVSLSWEDARAPHFKCSFNYSKDAVQGSEIYCSEQHDDPELKRYVFLETNLSKQVVNTSIRFPHIGEYLFDIYGSFEEGVYHKISSYRFIYASYQKSETFPQNTREEWGPGLDTYLLGLTPLTHHSGEIVFSSHVLQLEFKDDTGIQLDCCLLKDGTKYEHDGINIVLLRDKDNDITFVVDFGQDIVGEFVLQILAKLQENVPAKNICNYLLKKEKASHIPRFLFDKDTNDDSDALTAPASGTMQLEIDCKDIIEMNVELMLKLNYEKMVSEHSRYWILDKKGTVDLNFPWKGKYIVRIFGRSSKKSREKLIRSETIKVDIPSEQWSPFPKMLEYWNPKVKLISPLTSHWQEKSELTLTMEVPGAHDVAVISPGGWYHLNLEENGQWKGYVWTGAKSTKCKLSARFEKGSDNFSALLWFKVTSEYDFRINQRRQVELRKVALRKAGAIK